MGPFLSMMAGHSAIQAAELWSATTQQAQAMEPMPSSMQYPRWDRWKNIWEPQWEYSTREAILAAVESLLHCHAGHLTGKEQTKSQAWVV